MHIAWITFSKIRLFEVKRCRTHWLKRIFQMDVLTGKRNQSASIWCVLWGYWSKFECGCDRYATLYWIILIIPVSLCMLSLVGHSEIFMYGTLSERPRYNCALQNSKCFWRLCDFGTFPQFFEVCCDRTPSVGHAVLLPCQHSFVAK